MKGSGKKTPARDLSRETLFELTLTSNITHTVFREIRNRLLRTKECLDNFDIIQARAVVDSLLRSPQETRRAR